MQKNSFNTWWGQVLHIVVRAAEERSHWCSAQAYGKSKVFKHRTEFKKSMLERGKEITTDYEVTDVQESEPLEYVLSTIKNHIKRITDYVEPDELIIYAENSSTSDTIHLYQNPIRATERQIFALCI